MSDSDDNPRKSADSDNVSLKASRSRSRSHSRKRYRRSRSRSFTRRHHYSRSRSRSPYNRRGSRKSRSFSPRYRKHDGESRRGNRSRSRSPMSNRRRHHGTRDNPRTSNCIGVFGLSLYTQERDLRDAFDRYGPIDEVKVVYDHQTGRSRGFAFLFFKHLEDAEEAKDRAPGTEIDGRKIRVDYSITERAHTPTPGVYLGNPTGGGHRGRSRRSPSPYYRDYRDRGRRGYYSRSRSRSRSYSPRHY